MAAWTNLLPRAPQSERVDAYSEYLKNQATQRDNQQKQQYNASRIAEQQALAAQHQRVNDHLGVLDKAYSNPNNVKINPDTGEMTVNYSGILSDVAKGGAGELIPGVDKDRIANETAAHAAVEQHIKSEAQKTDSLMRHISTIDPVTDWNNQAQVDRFRTQAIQATNGAEREGAIDKNTAAMYRQRAANPTPDLQDELQQSMKAGPNVLKVYEQYGKINDNVSKARLAPFHQTKAEADANLAQTNATKAEIGLASQIPIVYPGANSEIGGNAPQAGYPGVTPPNATPAYAPPQAAPAPATGNVDPRTGQPYINPTPNTAPMSEDARAQGIQIPSPPQASWDAKRKQFPRASIAMNPEFSPQAVKDLNTAALTPEQQVTKPGTDLRNTGTELDNQDKTMKAWGKRLSIAASRGPGSYAREYDQAPDEIKKLADDPDKFDSKETRRRALMLGENTSQSQAAEDRENKPAGGKGATPVQLNTIESAKNAALKAAKNAYQKDTASVLGKTKVGQHLSTLRDATQNAQNEYENKLKQFGLEVKHMEYPAASEWDKGGFPKSGASTPATKPAPKSATMDQVKAYAAKSGKTEAQVIQEAKDSGIDVQ